MKRIFRRWWLLPAALIVLLAVLVLRPDPVEVDTALAATAPMRELVREDGRTRVRDRYTVASPFAGRLERIGVREGARVTPGEVVARIAPAQLDERTERQAQAAVAAADAAVGSAAALVTQAEAALANARRSLERRRILAEQGAIAQETLEQYELDVALRAEELHAATAAVAAARADARAARAALLDAPAGAGLPVRAPAAGRVLRVPDPSARVVAAGTPLLEIGETNAIEVVVPVLSEDAVRIREGACVEITGWGGDSILEARVREVEPSGYTEMSALGIEEQRVDVIIDLRALPAALGDNYRVDAAIVLWQTEAALQVPSSALVRRGETWTVFAVEDGRAVIRAVDIGHRDGASAEILGGLDEGDEVILFPSDRIDDGVRVRARAR